MALREWFDRHADTANELIVGFHRKATGRPGVTWPESVDEALCVGWIDGIRHTVDAVRYRIRFTSRRPGSTWSAVNIRRVRELKALGRMRPAGLAAFKRRTAAKSRIGSYEQAKVAFDSRQIREFRRDPEAWKFFGSWPPGYKKKVIWWIVSAKQAETRARRLATLIDACRRKRRL